MLEFKDIEIKDKTIIRNYIDNKTENSEMNFTNLFIWAECYNTQYVVWEDVLIVANISSSGRYLCFFPKGNGNIKQALCQMREFFTRRGEPLFITNASEEEAELFKEIFPEGEVTENRDFEDYVYSRESLVSLSGKKLHSKKNHLNRFKKQYTDYVYREMTKNDFDNCMVLAERLISEGNHEGEISNEWEIMSIKSLFENFDALGLKGGIIEVKGEIVAFTIGEGQNDKCAIIHVEKADRTYEGIYAAINNEFVSKTLTEYEFINREEDMGLDGLRKAKLSYRPHHMVKKYKCRID